MSLLRRRSHTFLLVSVLGCALCCTAAVPLSAAPLALAADASALRVVATSPSLNSLLAIGLLLLGGLASVVAVLRRSPLIPRRVEDVVSQPRTTATPNAGFGWGIGN
jgi:hypothetical protein